MWSVLKPYQPYATNWPCDSQLKGAVCEAGDASEEQSSESDASEQSSCSARSDEDAPRRVVPHQRPHSHPTNKRVRVVGRVWVASLSARSNQDQQRRFEERAARQMRAALARRAALTPSKAKAPAGGVYAKLEAEWRERHGQRPRNAVSARPRQPANKYK
ncbi:uncharacterized protein LOC114360001 [Ostrinia furnacalis]|uniref:uncharacterized protein LOC114360001 n=1 Tax=Ostrinia furnacalis TaxID=93504 RepID=UPI00103B8330|nr:uncharacterized protein LOC114360001 [Ostrinia furnacalis]